MSNIRTLVDFTDENWKLVLTATNNPEDTNWKATDGLVDICCTDKDQVIDLTNIHSSEYITLGGIFTRVQIPANKNVFVRTKTPTKTQLAYIDSKFDTSVIDAVSIQEDIGKMLYTYNALISDLRNLKNISVKRMLVNTTEEDGALIELTDPTNNTYAWLTQNEWKAWLRKVYDSETSVMTKDDFINWKTILDNQYLSKEAYTEIISNFYKFSGNSDLVAQLNALMYSPILNCTLGVFDFTDPNMVASSTVGTKHILYGVSNASSKVYSLRPYTKYKDGRVELADNLRVIKDYDQIVCNYAVEEYTDIDEVYLAPEGDMALSYAFNNKDSFTIGCKLQIKALGFPFTLMELVPQDEYKEKKFTIELTEDALVVTPMYKSNTVTSTLEPIKELQLRYPLSLLNLIGSTKERYITYSFDFKSRQFKVMIDGILVVDGSIPEDKFKLHFTSQYYYEQVKFFGTYGIGTDINIREFYVYRDAFSIEDMLKLQGYMLHHKVSPNGNLVPKSFKYYDAHPIVSLDRSSVDISNMVTVQEWNLFKSKLNNAFASAGALAAISSEFELFKGQMTSQLALYLSKAEASDEYYTKGISGALFSTKEETDAKLLDLEKKLTLKVLDKLDKQEAIDTYCTKSSYDSLENKINMLKNESSSTYATKTELVPLATKASVEEHKVEVQAKIDDINDTFKQVYATNEKVDKIPIFDRTSYYDKMYTDSTFLTKQDAINTYTNKEEFNALERFDPSKYDDKTVTSTFVPRDEIESTYATKDEVAGAVTGADISDKLTEYLKIADAKTTYCDKDEFSLTYENVRQTISTTDNKVKTNADAIKEIKEKNETFITEEKADSKYQPKVSQTQENYITEEETYKLLNRVLPTMMEYHPGERKLISYGKWGVELMDRKTMYMDLPAEYVDATYYLKGYRAEKKHTGAYWYGIRIFNEESKGDDPEIVDTFTGWIYWKNATATGWFRRKESLFHANWGYCYHILQLRDNNTIVECSGKSSYMEQMAHHGIVGTSFRTIHSRPKPLKYTKIGFRSPDSIQPYQAKDIAPLEVWLYVDVQDKDAYIRQRFNVIEDPNTIDLSTFKKSGIYTLRGNIADAPAQLAHAKDIVLTVIRTESIENSPVIQKVIPIDPEFMYEYCRLITKDGVSAWFRQ